MSASDLRLVNDAPDEVLVTITTDRTDQPDGVREAETRGPFETALRDALALRCKQWAIDQVLSGVLSRRPARGEPGEWFGAFCSTRTIRVIARPTIGPGADESVRKVRPIPGLFIPAALVSEAA